MDEEWFRCWHAFSLPLSRGDGVPALRRSALPMAGPRPCGLSASRCRVPRAPRGYAAVRDWRLTPQLWATRAPRRHALALKAKLQRLAGAERRAAASGPRASRATRRQPVSCFRSTPVRTVRQMSYNRAWRPKLKYGVLKNFSDVSRPLHPSTPHGSGASRPEARRQAAAERTWNCSG